MKTEYEDDENFAYHKEIEMICGKLLAVRNGEEVLGNLEYDVSILYGLTQLVAAVKENSRLVWYLNLPASERIDVSSRELWQIPERKNFKSDNCVTETNGDNIFFLSLNPNSSQSPEYYPFDHELVAKVLWGCVGKDDNDVNMSYDNICGGYIINFPTTGGLDRYTAKVLVAKGQRGCCLSVYFDSAKDVSNLN